MTNILQVLFAGGWIPKGKRTQWLGVATVACTLVMALVKWGSGGMDVTHFLQIVSDNWQPLVMGLGLSFLGDKVDGVKS